MASLFDKLKKRVEGAVAQVNPFDSGRTYNTVLQNRQPAPPKPISPNLQALPGGNPASARNLVIDTAREIPKGFIRIANTLPDNLRTGIPVADMSLDFLKKPFGMDKQGTTVTPSNRFTKAAFGEKPIVNAPQDIRSLPGQEDLPGIIAVPAGLALNSPIGKPVKGGVKVAKNVVTPSTQTVVQQPKTLLKTVVTEKSLPPAIPGTKTVMGGNPPNLPVKTSVPPNQKQTRFAGSTIPQSEYVSPGVKERIDAPMYDVNTERMAFTESANRVKQVGPDRFAVDAAERLNVKPGTISRQDAADAETAAAYFDSLGDSASLQKSADIYEKLSEHFTAGGQLVQAAAIMSRRTPQGLRYHAEKTLKQAGIKPTNQLRQQLDSLIQARTAAKTQPEVDRAIFEINKLVSDQIPSSIGERVINFWRAGLLTAPTTSGGNLLGNTGETAIRKLWVNPIATAADKAMGIVTGKRTVTIAPAGSATKGAKQGTGKLPAYFKSGFDERKTTAKYENRGDLNYGDGPLGKALSRGVNSVYRAMGTADMPYWYAARSESLGSIAKAEALSRGIPRKERANWIQEFINNPPASAIERAAKEADYATFQNDTLLGRAAQGLKRPLGPVGDFIVPFTRVPASIATRIVERTPVGTAKEMVKQIINVKNGLPFDQRAMAQAIGNGTFGIIAVGAGVALAKSGDLTFGFPEDKKERELWEAEGKQPYSVRFGDRWYSLNYLQPFGTLLAMGGEAANAIKEGADATSTVSQAVATGAQAMQNQSFLKGISGILDAVDDPKRYASQYVENTAGSVVPNFFRSLARAGDEVQRDPEGVLQGVQASIPGMREDVPAKTDLFGEPTPAKDNFANQFLNPLKPSKVREDDLTKELRSLQDVGEGIVPTEAKKDTFGKDQEVSREHIKQLNTELAKASSGEWSKIIADPRYKSLSVEEKRDVLQDVSNTVGGVVKAKFAAENDYINDNWEPKLTKRQQAYLSGEAVDFIGDKEKKIAKSKGIKVAKKKGTKVSKGKKGGKGKQIPAMQSVSTKYLKPVTISGGAGAPSGKLSKKPGMVKVAQRKPVKIGGQKLNKMS